MSRQRPSTTRHTTRSVLVTTLAAVAMAVATVGAVLGPQTAASASTLDGVATISDPLTQAPVTAGASTTPFTLVLPAQAACSGDSANDGYRVFSYLVQKGTDVTSITFPDDLPNVSDGQYGLVESDGTYYGDVNTAQTTGQIIGIPNDFEFGPLVSTDGLLSTLLYTGGASGVWEAGLACTNGSGVVTDYWNTEVTFTSSGSDTNGFVWSTGFHIQPSTLPSATRGLAYSAQLTASGGVAPYKYTVSSGSLPTKLKLNKSSGLLSGTPSVAGTYAFTVTATSADKAKTSASQSYSVTVSTPIFFISTTSLPTATIGQAYSTQLTVAGGEAPVKWKATGLPKGLKLSSTGLLAGTVSAKKGTPGNYTVAVTVTDSSKPKNVATTDLTLTLSS